MQPYPYARYQNAGPGPVRYMVPPGYRPQYPPFVNRSFDRYDLVPTTLRAPPPVRPMNYPPAYGPAYGQGVPPAQPAANQPAPTVRAPRPPAPNGTQSRQQQYFNPNDPKKKNSIASLATTKTPTTAKKGAKEFRDAAFTIESDGSKNDAIRGLVSNDDINNLLKHKGTKVKVSKIYRITKTKPEEIADSSDDDVPPPPPPPLKTQRPPTADSYCSECGDRPCSQCLAERPAHPYDDCALCRAQQQIHTYDDCAECRALRQTQTHVYDDCAECRAERNRALSRRQGAK